MAESNYDRADIARALAELPLQTDDVVFIHANLGFFGRRADAHDMTMICAAFFDAIFARVGPDATLVVPTFTYSFPRGEVFDAERTASAMGSFAEWVRRRPDAIRSQDPCYSVAAVGAKAEQLTREVSCNSFDNGSFFSRFGAVDGKVLNLNFDAGSTFVHFVERELRVPYRFDKTFSGLVREGQELRPRRSTIWVRYQSDDSLEADFEAFDGLARSNGKFVTAALGRGELGVISARDTYRLIADTLPQRPWFLTRAEKLGIAQPRIVAEP